MKNRIFYGDNKKILSTLDSSSVNLIYSKPPSIRDKSVTDYLADLKPRFLAAYKVLSQNGTLYFHSDQSIVHYCKVNLLDPIFENKDCFINEIIWTYESNEKVTNRWNSKHDTILVYVKDPSNYTFNIDEIDRIPYLAPGLVTEEKEAKGKLPTDTWWYTNIADNGQDESATSNLPHKIFNRIVNASSNEGDTVLDMYARDGAIAVSSLELNRKFILIENSKKALRAINKKLGNQADVEWVNFDPKNL